MKMNNPQLKNVWDDVLAVIKDKLNQKLGDSSLSIFSVYYLDSSLFDLTEKNAVVAVSNNFQKLVLQQEKDLIEDALETVLERKLACNIYNEKELSPFSTTTSPNIPIVNHDDHLISNFTFDNFVVGPSNQETHSAALSCAINPGNYFNPIFIFGSSGLGKTHLLHAIGNKIKETHPEKRILYISSLEFVEKMVSAINNRTIDDFKNSMNALDVFLVDDIQFIAGKEKSHEVFFQIFNNLVNNRKQIVLTCDRLPSEIKGLERRLMSRFNSGLSVGITSPEFETSIAILKKKLELQTVDPEIIEDDVLVYLATNFSTDIRSLEGSINRLIFYAITFNKETIDLKTAMEAFKGHGASTKEISISTIKKCVANYYGLKISQLSSSNRTKNLVMARHIAMYLCRKHLDVSFAVIGKEFGNRDHSTVVSAYDKIEKGLKKDSNLKIAISEIESNFVPC